MVDAALARDGVRRSVVTLTDVLETACAQDNYRVYDEIPPKMVSACKNVVAAWDEVDDVEAVLVRGDEAGGADGAAMLRRPRVL